MTPLEQAAALAGSGRYSEALAALNHSPIPTVARSSAEILRAELLQRTEGRFSLRGVVDRLLTLKLTPDEKIRCQMVLARIERENGDTSGAINRLQKAISSGDDRKTQDPKLHAWCLIMLTLYVADSSGPDATAPLIAKLRASLTKIGSGQLWAALHMCVASIDARRGLIRNARSHTRMAYSLLSSEPHLWIEAHLRVTDFGVAMKACDFTAALSHARAAVELAHRSGSVTLLRNCFGNLCYVLCALGQYEDATSWFDKAMAIFPSFGNNHAAVVETAARVRLAQGHLHECATLLDQIDERSRNSSDRCSYSNREAALTRARLLARQGQIAEAVAQCDTAVSLAEDVKDIWLLRRALFSKAEFLVQLDQPGQALSLIDDHVGELLDEPVDLFAQYERLVGVALGRAGLLEVASSHFDRARRVYVGTCEGPELGELERQIERVSAATMPDHGGQPVASHALLHDVSAMFIHAGRPALLGQELVHILERAGVVQSAALITRADDDAGDRPDLTDRPRAAGSGGTDVPQRRLPVGISDGRRFDVAFAPKSDIESLATLNSVRLLLAAAQELDRARAERETRLTLWPLEDEPAHEDGFILLGKMRALMIDARRVAKANITVLITGESGTGKEVLARALHKYSDRANKPFIPFNCAAIPRDLVESHLFGHRRGAFTGADRDSLGIIRSARGGIIFLDEVGELSLDLQPKLLRFLESGEIAPLGEGSPSTVDVRVVAATNAKLETAVNEGRFREDLFYRLNVVRLDIPPLRERRDEIAPLVNHFVTMTVREFGKGRVRLAEETMEHFLVHRWPGNVRQLLNEVRRIVALAEPDSVIPPSSLAPDILNRHLLAPPKTPTGEIAVPVHDKLHPTLSRIEREMVKAALRDAGGRLEAAAKALGISRKGLYLKRQRLGL